MTQVKLSKKYISKVCKDALKEDLFPNGDITSKLLKNNKKSKAKIISNSTGIIGGLDLAKQTFKLIDKKISFKIKKREGSKIKKRDLIAVIEGNIKNILIGERVALNFLSHVSGIATKTNNFVQKIGKKTKICCTRKTIPGLRVLQKYSVSLGGGLNHRFNLSDEYLIKDNQPEKVMMVTECSMSDNVQIDNPNVKFIRPCNLCPHMKRITLPKVLECLENETNEILMSDETIEKARKSVERMTEIGR